ncbi:hypothetical protein ACFLU8_02885 [Chloroflexota bacterium]
MGKLNDIRQKLSAGSTTSQLIDQGYAKSSVFSMARKLKDSQSDIPATLVSDELQDLRRQRDMIKLQKEIAELEAAKEKLPERVAALELSLEELPARIMFLEKQTTRLLDAVENLFFEMSGITLLVQEGDYGVLMKRTRTDQDSDKSEKQAIEFANKYRVERGV